LSFREEDKAEIALPHIEARHVSALESLIDELGAVTGPLENFILPGGAETAALLHIARTVCRRAERDVITLQWSEAVGEQVLEYLNRLSDALFVMARYENLACGIPEPLWDSRR
jgi:cob(I)alamin adenosyltransferase